MDLKGLKVLVIGLARSGIATVKALNRLGAVITINDMKREEDVYSELEQLKEIPVTYILGSHPEEILDDVDMIIPNPGVPLDLPILSKAKERGIDIISEVELAYRLTRASIVGITGTNGKTTTTSLTGEIFKNANRSSYVVGNIGVPVISHALDAKTGDVFVCELSSFQLESTYRLKPKVSAILNITPDHLNRHKTMENYIDAKARIFANQDSSDYTVLNYDNEVTQKLAQRCNSKVIFFSRKVELDNGVFVKDDIITIRNNGEEHRVCDIRSILISGSHNLENALAATAMAWIMGVDLQTIAYTLKNFGGVEHRGETAEERNGIKFINNSKATNPDAAIKAIDAVSKPIILIAGGMEKDNDYSEFIQSFEDKIKHMILLGETADKIEAEAKKNNFYNITKVKTLQQAVTVAFNIASTGDNVLLAPACASWDMFENFEQRGRIFKEEVRKLREGV
jgi:UDP-N-acetylmuramoylalanine--D-glutamate ligase